MNKFTLTGVALGALISGSAVAADLRRPLPAPPPPVYVFSWTGCYAGGNVGGLWVNKDFTVLAPAFGPGNPFFGQSFSANANSVLGGVQAGCNYQFAGGWVLGVQGDYDWTDAHRDRDGVLFTNFTDSFKVKSVASVTGRIGYAWDRFLGYVKGGGAWERDDITFAFIPTGTIATVSDTRSGWTVGVGAEYAFTNWITGFVEYDHYDFGTSSDNFVCVPIACFGRTFGFPVDIKETKNVVKVGLNFLWGPGPFAGRY